MTTAGLIRDTSLLEPLRVLADRDSDFAAAFDICGLPPVRQLSVGFEGVLNTILAQQVSALATRAIRERLYEAVGVLTPLAFLGLDDNVLRTVGLSGQKIRYGRGIAQATLSRELDFDAIARMDDDAAVTELCKIRGIGPWTAECYLLFSLGRPDVWPAADLAVQEAFKRLKRMRKRPATEQMRKLGNAWRPHRSAAARFLWHYYKHPGV